MSPQLGLVILVAAVLISVILSPKFKVNIGVTAMLFAFLIGYWCCGLGSGVILGYFPTMLVITTILSTFMFGFVARAGVSQGVSARIMYLFRNHVNLVPFALLIATYVITSLGAGAFASPVIMSPIAFAMAEAVGFSPLLAALAVCTGSGLASNVPWLGAPLVRQYVTELFGEQYVDSAIWFNHNSMLPIWIGGFIVIYFLTGAFKCSTKNGSVTVEKPEPFNPLQKKILYLLGAFILLVAVPPVINSFFPNPVAAFLATKFDFYPLSVISILILANMGIESTDKVVREDISWGAVLMLGGTGMLIKLLTPLGAVDLLANWIVNSVSENWAVAMLILVGALLSLFVNGAVGVQTLAPIVAQISSLYSNLSGVGAYVALQNSVGASCFSPFSTGGALAMTGCRDDKVRDKVSRQLVAVAIIYSILTILQGRLGWFNLFQM